MNGSHVHPQRVMDAALELATGEPELVVVDARALRLIMGPLGQLLILRPLHQGGPRRGGLPFRGSDHDPDVEGYVWDDDELCPEKLES